MQWYIFGVLLVAGVCLAVELEDLEINKLDELPAVKERCVKKGKADSYDRLKIAINETKACMESKVSPAHIKEELEEAKKTGSMDEVFGKYCNKRQEYKECAMKTIRVTKECLEETEINALDTAIRVIQEVADFACYRDGDRLAMFVAEGGPECITSRTEQIKECLNNTLKIDTSNLSFNSIPTDLPNLKIDNEKCNKLSEIQECVVSDLEKNCKDTTPANIVDALFKFVKKSTCKNIKKRSVSPRVKRNYIEFYALKAINSSGLNQKVLQECKKNGGEKAYNEFWNVLNFPRACLGNNKIFVTPKNEFLRSLNTCIEENVNKVENCLNDDLKFYPRFMATAVQAVVEFIYDHMNLRNLTPDNELVPCFQRIRSVGGIEKKFSQCTKDLNRNKILENSLPDKITVCNLMNELNDCFKDFVKNTCAPDIAVDIFLGNFTLAIQKPCKGD